MPFPVEVALIHEAERQLGRKLPIDLRLRLHRDNGGGIRAAGDYWSLFPVFDPSDRKRIGRTASHIVRETRAARGRPGFPEDAIAIPLIWLPLLSYTFEAARSRILLI